MSETYAKVGRGGAGNYYSPQDVEEAAKKLKEDVEAQQNTTTSQRPKAGSAQPEYSHAGRGGAGNYQPTPPTTTVTNELSTSMKQAAAPEGGYSGRGGAGNFRGTVERGHEEGLPRDTEAHDKAYEETVRDVEQGLQQPEKAHVASEKLGEQ